jgi:hypothetical protein
MHHSRKNFACSKYYTKNNVNKYGETPIQREKTSEFVLNSQKRNITLCTNLHVQNYNYKCKDKFKEYSDQKEEWSQSFLLEHADSSVINTYIISTNMLGFYHILTRSGLFR